MEILSFKNHAKKHAPIKILQFGEGNFLRAFIDWMIQKMNDSGEYEGHVALVQPLPNGRVKELMDQDGLYTLILQGLVDGKAKRTNEIIDVIDEAVNPYSDYEKFLDYGRLETLEVVISNTTEAGIVYDENDTKIDILKTTPNSYPAKLLALLKARYIAYKGEKPLAIIPCELIDDNGDKLKEVLIKLATALKEEKGFIDYISDKCAYTSTLVDRIVPGFPRDDFKELCEEYGYIDNNMVKAEIFDFFVLKQNPLVEKVFPVHKFDLEAYYVEDIHPYKKRKVRVLNGAHTALVPVAYLCGLNEVGESLKNERVAQYLKELVFNEVVPTVDVKGIEKFANDVFARFLNPYVHHMLMSIALNSLPKYKERDLPTLLDNIKADKTPQRLLFALASLILFYKGERVVAGVKEEIKLADSKENLDFMKEVWATYDKDLDVAKVVKTVLSNENIWGSDLTTYEVIVSRVTHFLEVQLKIGTYEALKEVI